jgi:hypothetical protein
VKAIVQDEYGTADAVRLADIDRPTAGSVGVLVRSVRRASPRCSADTTVDTNQPQIAYLDASNTSIISYGRTMPLTCRFTPSGVHVAGRP